MCGIAGVVDSLGRPVEMELLRAMAAKLVHRGPDDEGFYRNARALGGQGNGMSLGFAFRRLSIIDLQGGHQPMANEDETCRLIFNGEIYNFPQLRPRLEALGHRFSTKSDCETLLHLYESYGIQGALERVRGMFAFALWDANSETLFLARDRLGKKPLLYYESAGRITFASEFASLLQDRRIRRQIDWSAVYHYLTFMCVPAPLSAFRGVKKLPPAHYLQIKAGKTEIRRYWQLETGPKLRLSREEACEAIREKLLESTRLRLISDVPLGVFLSGGIDSSSVVAAMSRAGNGKVKTFSIGFAEKKFNELPHARIVARHYDTEHREFVVEPKALEVLPMLVERYGEPYADSSAIPSYYLARMTRQHVTVALNGDGGDESFTGYRRHYANRMADIFHRLPSPARLAVCSALRLLSPRAYERSSLVAGLRRFAEAADRPRPERFTRWMGFFTEQEKRALLAPEALAQIGSASSPELLNPLFGQAGSLEGADAAAFVDAMFYLPNDLLVKMDIATMAVSLEGRSPFLDHELMEFASRLPAGFRLRGNRLKAILKEAVRPWLPQEILKKPKWGFAVPVGKWFRGELRQFLQDHLLDDTFARRGYFRSSEVEKLVKLHLEGRRDLGHHLWILLMFELWQRAFFDS
ncbi:MAG: asparagine synthase (glutamine-hydrolyzing) [Deltaproteobacteria bacterium]|nr:asparagine synthase (glutamine-hydrolyzing) [Deltaproteobacteria bacterium]